MRARLAWEEAAAEYASTAEGHQVLSKQIESLTASGDTSTAAMLTNVVMRGEAMRMANQDAAALIKAATLTQLPAKGVDATEAGFIRPATAVVDEGRGWATYESPDRIEEDRNTSDMPVPVLRPEEREKIETVLKALDGLNEDISFDSTPASKVAQGLRTADDIIGNGASDDVDLARAVGLLRGAERALTMYPSNARALTNLDIHGDEARSRRSSGYAHIEEVWGPASGSSWEMTHPQVRRALTHPGAGTQTFERARKTFNNEALQRFMSGLPDCPSATLAKMAWDGDEIAPAGWDRVRRESQQSGSLTAALALNDPDRGHQLAAVERLKTIPMIDLSHREQMLLAGLLRGIPGNESQEMLAVRLADHVRQHGTDLEREEVRSMLAGSGGVGAEKAAKRIRLSTERRGLFR